MAVATGSFAVNGRSGSPWAPVYAPAAYLFETDGRSSGSPSDTCSNKYRSHSISGMVDTQRQCDGGHILRDIPSPGSADDGLVNSSLGSSPNIELSPPRCLADKGVLEQQTNGSTHQCQGTDVSFRGIESVGESPPFTEGEGRVRQQDDSVTHKQTGHCALPEVAQSDPRAPHLVREQGDSDSGSVSTRLTERIGGQTLETGSGPSYRVVTVPISGKQSVSAVGSTDGGSFRHQRQLQITKLREHDTGSTGICRGRLIDRLEGNVRLRVPPSNTASQSATKASSNATMSDDFGSALMAADAVVTSSRKTRGRTIKGHSVGSKSVISDSGKRKKGAPSKSSSPKA